MKFDQSVDQHHTPCALLCICCQMRKKRIKSAYFFFWDFISNVWFCQIPGVVTWSRISIEQCISHDDAIKWKHFPRCWPFLRGILGQKPVTRSFDVFFDLRLNKQFSKQSWGWWFETPSRTLWPCGNGTLLQSLHQAYMHLFHKWHVYISTLWCQLELLLRLYVWDTK